MASVYLWSGEPNVIKALEGAAQGSAYKKGDLVKAHANGLIVVGTAASFIGVAQEDPTNTTSTVTSIDLLRADNIYVMRAAGGTTTNQTDVYEESDITFTAGAHTLAANTTSGVDAIILGLHPEDGAKAGGRYLVRFVHTVIYGNHA